MIREVIIAGVCLIFGFTAAAGAENVTFKSNSKTEDGKPLMLAGELLKPDGDGPFPAVVMLHGCSGIERFKKSFDIWAQRLANWGYVSLQVDSFVPRGNPDVCNEPFLIPPQQRAQDAHDAKLYLTGFPFVNRNQIALMGWSHGGWTVLFTIAEGTYIQNRRDPFRLAIAFYPYCSIPLRGLNAPLLILSGELDEVCPPQMCNLRMPSGKTTPEIILKVYPQAYHTFDLEGEDTQKGGDVLYNPVAANDAIEQVRKFFTKHLK
jgi:dienelactone hydrolase